MLRLAFPYLEAGMMINAPSRAVWDLLVDTTRWAQWGPSICGVESSDRILTPLSSGRIKTVLGFSVPFAVTHFEEGKAWSWRVFGIPATTHTVERLGAIRSRLLFGVPIPAFPYLFVCLIAMRRIAGLTEAVRDPTSFSRPPTLSRGGPNCKKQAFCIGKADFRELCELPRPAEIRKPPRPESSRIP